MVKILIDKDKFLELVDFYQKCGKPYKYINAGSSHTLFIGSVCYYHYSAKKRCSLTGDMIPDRLPAKQISFIQKVKRYILKNGIQNKIKPNYTDVEKIKYIDWNKSIGVGETFEKCHCIDINGAYWKAFLNQGFIQKEMHAEGLKKDKRIRLACLGTFAKTQYIWVFDGIQEKMVDKKTGEFPHLFFNSANLIYKCMEECKNELGSDFLFYWTDCVYVKSVDALVKCSEIIQKHRFEAKTQQVTRVTFTKHAILVNDKDNKKEKKYSLDLI